MPIKHILIIKFAAFGDVVRTAYLLPALAARHPDARIDWLTADPSVELLRANPHIARLATPTRHFDQLTATRYDLVVALEEDAAILALSEQIERQRTIGCHLTGGKPCYTAESAPWFDMSLISRLGKEEADRLKQANRREHHEFLAAMLDIAIESPSLFLPPGLRESVAERFDPRCFNIGLNAGCGARWPSKALPLRETIALVRQLLSLRIAGKPVCLHLLGGADQAPRHAAIRAACASERLCDTGSNNPLPVFAALVGNCDYVISSDSLALHLAIAQGVRNLSFFAPTSAAEIGTFASGVKVISLAADYCSYRPDADTATLTAERLLAALRRHLGLA